LVDWKGLIREDRRIPMLVVKVFLGDCYHVAWTDREVVPDDWRTRVFTPRQWEALFPPPLDETD